MTRILGKWHCDSAIDDVFSLEELHIEDSLFFEVQRRGQEKLNARLGVAEVVDIHAKLTEWLKLKIKPSSDPTYARLEALEGEVKELSDSLGQVRAELQLFKKDVAIGANYIEVKASLGSLDDE